MKPPARPLYKQNSWSPDVERDKQWQRRQGIYNSNQRIHRSSKSVTDDDVEELKGCVDLGFGFSHDSEPRLVRTLPALGFYNKVNSQYGKSLSRSSSSSSFASSNDSSIDFAADSIFDPGEDPETVKARLKQWAQVVACSVRQL